MQRSGRADESGRLGTAAVRELLAPGKTGAFVGPSGSGKTSLLNALAGRELARTGSVRPERYPRAAHHNVNSVLHRLRRPADLDTPGLRELQLWGQTESADAAFPRNRPGRSRLPLPRLPSPKRTGLRGPPGPGTGPYRTRTLRGAGCSSVGNSPGWKPAKMENARKEITQKWKKITQKIKTGQNRQGGLVKKIFPIL